MFYFVKTYSSQLWPHLLAWPLHCPYPVLAFPEAPLCEASMGTRSNLEKSPEIQAGKTEPAAAAYRMLWKRMDTWVKHAEAKRQILPRSLYTFQVSTSGAQTPARGTNLVRVESPWPARSNKKA